MGRRTPLYDRHAAAGARLVDFAGYDMPLQYSGIREEHVAVRARAGLFDVSHMGEVLAHGEGAAAFVQHLVTNDVSRLHDNQALYTVMCTDDGGIVDDLIVVRGDQTHWMIVVNAATREKDIAWMRAHLGADVELIDASDDIALLAVQGPRAVAILEPLVTLTTGAPLAELPSFHTSPAHFAGIDERHAQRIARTGYTGEDGFEVYIAAEAAGALWDLLLEAGAPEGLVPAGLGARDTLRLEAGLRLYGQDMDESVDPYSCALGWTVKAAKGDFVGASALGALRQAPRRRFVGLGLGPRSIARHGQRVLQQGTAVGEITSGTMGFTVGHPIATASLDPATDLDAPLAVDIRGSEAPATIVPLPFYRRPKGDG